MQYALKILDRKEFASGWPTRSLLVSSFFTTSSKKEKKKKRENDFA
jgi:hypothetical protein